jgi:hypothetical protein
MAAIIVQAARLGGTAENMPERADSRMARARE